MADQQAGMQEGLTSPADNQVAITPSDSTDLAYTSRAIRVGVGGTSDQCVALAKRAATRALGTRCSDEEGAKLEVELSSAVNQLGIGPQGLGGDGTAFAVHVELAATHITMNPVAVNMQCHSARRARVSITPQGVAYGF
jgi:fumarate hydratase subunit alpha